MNANIERQFALLESGKRTQAAVAVINNATELSPQAGELTNALAAKFLASPSATAELVRLLEDTSDARFLLAHLLTTTDESSARSILTQKLASSEDSSVAIKAFVKAMSSSSNQEQGVGCFALMHLMQDRRQNARLAADAGAIGKLVRLMHSAGADVRVYAAMALDRITVGSTNRAKKAAKEGAIKALGSMLSPAATRTCRITATITLHNLARSICELPDDEAVPLQDCIDGVSRLLVQQDIGDELKSHACGTLANICKARSSLEAAVAAALSAVNAAPLLLRLVTHFAEQDVPSALTLVDTLLRHRPSQAQAVVAAGGIELAKCVLRQAGDSLGGQLRSCAASGVLGSLAAISPAYAEMVGGATLLEAGARVARFEQASAERAPELDVCAACGKKGGELKRCSACGQVVYCNVGCQRAHWKVHKPACGGHK